MEHHGPGDPDSRPAAAPPGAAAVFGARLSVAEEFVAVLADTGVSHGLVGPREVPRLWDRHVLNCAVVADAFPEGAEVVDVGSGAGLPGIALAVARPDLRLHLVEPMLRRTTWLEETVARLGLGEQVVVHRGRAEEMVGRLSAPWVTARAVARLDRLARWCLPLVSPGGTLVAMKGRSAAEELEVAQDALRRLGVVETRVSEHGRDVLDDVVLTVDCRLGETTPGGTRRGSDPGRRGSDRRGARRGGRGRRR